jgi:thiamine biosynthesis lipoprotein
MARIALREGGLATSGDYERFMIIEGVRYSHLLDPRSGESFLGGPACVSVVASHCLVAGVTSTIAMLHPEADAIRFLEDVGLIHLAVSQTGRISGSARLLAPEAREEAPGPRSAPARA